MCRSLGVAVVGVAVPDVEDRLSLAARAARCDVVRHKDLEALAVMRKPDVILAAHCHGFISTRTREAAQFGCLAYHPSLLPRHRGRDAVAWTLRFKDEVAGGTLYRMDDGADTGPICYQEWCWVLPSDDAATLWRRELGPLGVTLFKRALMALQAGLSLPLSPQPEAVATWEPALAQKPLSHLK